MRLELNLEGILVNADELNRFIRSRLSNFTEQQIQTIIAFGRGRFMADLFCERMGHIFQKIGKNHISIEGDADGTFRAAGTRDAIQKLFLLMEEHQWGTFSEKNLDTYHHLPSSRFG